MIGYCLNMDILNNIENKSINDIEDDLLINDTKLYFALLRCLCKDSKDRYFYLFNFCVINIICQYIY